MHSSCFEYFDLLITLLLIIIIFLFWLCNQQEQVGTWFHCSLSLSLSLRIRQYSDDNHIFQSKLFCHQSENEGWTVVWSGSIECVFACLDVFFTLFSFFLLTVWAGSCGDCGVSSGGETDDDGGGGVAVGNGLSEQAKFDRVIPSTVFRCLVSGREINHSNSSLPVPLWLSIAIVHSQTFVIERLNRTVFCVRSFHRFHNKLVDKFAFFFSFNFVKIDSIQFIFL